MISFKNILMATAATAALLGFVDFAQAGPVLQGPVLNGPVLQGPVLNGPVLQGPVLQGPVLQGMRMNGPELRALTAERAPITGAAIGGPVAVTLPSGETMAVH
jgi:hypothetical protein